MNSAQYVDKSGTDNWQGFCRAYARQFKISYAAAICEAGPAWHEYKKVHKLEFKHEKKAKAAHLNNQKQQIFSSQNGNREEEEGENQYENKKQAHRKEGKRPRTLDIPLVKSQTKQNEGEPPKKKKKKTKDEEKLNHGEFAVYHGQQQYHPSVGYPNPHYMYPNPPPYQYPPPQHWSGGAPPQQPKTQKRKQKQQQQQSSDEE